MAETVQYYGTGRRKAAIARVFLRPGSGEFKVNGKGFDEYFVTPSQRIAAKSPLVSTDSAATFNVLANVCGGGVAGQADAVRLGITRALMEFNAELRGKLKAEGMVTRDPRAKERKKYGQKGAASASSSASGKIWVGCLILLTAEN
jgi:small subunit ribosomal protein S9